MSSPSRSATAIAHPNIAFIKYWGNRDHALRLPVSGSLSMNLAGLETRTTVRFSEDIEDDTLTIDGVPQHGPALARVSALLDIVRRRARLPMGAAVESSNNFPMGAGIASSASAFAALALAGSTAAGLDLTEAELSALARRGSGSASRSIPGGFVEWHTGHDNASSFATSIAPADHWALVDLVAVVSQAHKRTGSTGGHAAADSSPLQLARIHDAPRRLSACRSALLQRDFAAFAEMIEHDTLMMHAVMLTSRPPLYYWQPATLAVMQAVTDWRERDGLACAFTIDAGPNVHVMCEAEVADRVADLLAGVDGVAEVRRAMPGGPARLADAGPAQD